jgi:hypothetical protein
LCCVFIVVDVLLRQSSPVNKILNRFNKPIFGFGLQNFTFDTRIFGSEKTIGSCLSVGLFLAR